MSTPDPTAIIKAPIGWAKARPVVFVIVMLLIVIGVIRFRNAITSMIAKATKIPLIGGAIAWLSGIGDDKGAPPSAAPEATTGPFLIF